MLETAFGQDGAPTDGIILHPRAYVALKSIIDGKDVDTGLIPSRVTLSKGDHTKCSEATITLEGSVLPFPLRLVGGSVITLYMGVTENPEDNVKQENNLRFVGFVEDLEQDQSARHVTLKAYDLTMPLRGHKPLLEKKNDDTGITIDPTPRYSDTLKQAIERILSVVPGFEEGSEPFLDLRDTDALSTASLGSLVTGRAKTGPVALKPDISAWGAIEHVCALAVRHVSVDLTDIVVRTSDEVFARAGEATALRFIVGTDYANSFPPKFHKKIQRNRKGVRVVAWDPETCKRVEAVYPTDSVMETQYSLRRPAPPKKKPKQKSTTPTKAPKEPDREVYELEEGHYTSDALEAKAKSIWLQRATQEADGSVSTPLWTEEVLGLQNGDRVFIKTDEMLRKQLTAIGSDADAVRFLQDQYAGMDQQGAQALLDAMKKPLQDFWYVNTVVYDWPGPRLCTVGVINLLEI